MLSRREFLSSCFLPLVPSSNQETYIVNLGQPPEGLSVSTDPVLPPPGSTLLYTPIKHELFKKEVTFYYKVEGETRTISFTPDKVWRLLQVFRSFF